jgi:hypothetical protein
MYTDTLAMPKAKRSDRNMCRAKQVTTCHKAKSKATRVAAKTHNLKLSLVPINKTAPHINLLHLYVFAF